MSFSILFGLGCFVVTAYSASLPTNYGYYTQGGIKSGLNADQRYFLLNGKNITIFSGALHYFRVHESSWRDRLRKLRAAGLNAVETYVPWNLHEYQSGKFDFGNGGSDFEEFLNITKFLQIAQEEDLFALVRAGPYICTEWEFGGLPSFLLREAGIKIRTSDEKFLKYITRYFNQLIPILAPFQFTRGGPVIALQVENEYGNMGISDSKYLHAIKDLYQSNGIVELLYTSDPPRLGTIGALPNELLMTANFNVDAAGHLNQLDSLQTNKPTMAMEYWSGWFDHVTENHHTISVEKYKQVYEDILLHPASVNIYTFIGSTNFGFTSGATYTKNGTDNSGLEPVTTSYDYDSPISENGDITIKWNATKELIEKHNLVKTALPEVPQILERIAFADIKIEEQILLTEILNSYSSSLQSEKIIPMELLEINDGSGQSFGYVVYRKTNVNLKAKATLMIKGYVRDSVLALVNGKLLTPVLSSKNDLNNFGYWRINNSTIILTEQALSNATIDLVIENNSRNNVGTLDQFQQFKGLTEDVLIDNEIISNWTIIPLEFKKAWNQQLSGWHAIQNKTATPALYRVTFNVATPLRDTYVNVQDWLKGIVIINGFVLGRVFAVGPQQALYLPAGLLRKGQNELIIFEQFSAPDYVKFSKNPIWGVGTYIH